jgi:hypothetical protein
LLLSAFSDVAAVPEAAPEVIVQHIVEPLSIPVKELGPKWQEGRSKLGQEVAAIDLAALNLQTAIRHLEVEAASILGAIVALKSVKDGPDWREQIGLAP